MTEAIKFLSCLDCERVGKPNILGMSPHPNERLDPTTHSGGIRQLIYN